MKLLGVSASWKDALFWCCPARCIALSLCIACFCLSPFSGVANARTNFSSYKDIPDVTKEEIDAIEDLQERRKRVLYGVNITMEAFVTENGSVDGFALLFCERLSTLFGITFVPQVYGWDEMKEKLGTGEVSFTGELTPNEERRKVYFMSDPIVQRTATIFSNRNVEKLSVIAKERPLRCSFLKGSIFYALVKDSWDLPFEPVFVDDVELPALFEKGLVDAFIDENTMAAIFDNCDFIRSESYFPLIYSPVSLTTADAELKPIISVLQKYLKHGGFAELSEMYKEGIARYSRHKLRNFLSPAELAYIDQHNTEATAVLVGMENDNYPASFYNVQEQAFQGITFDVLDQFENLTGLRFKVANTPEAQWPEMLEDLESGKISLISELLRSKQREEHFVWADEPYCVDYYTLLSRADFPDADINQILYAKVGLIEDSAYADLFREWFPASVNTVTYVGLEEAFDALEKGEIDLLMGTQNMLLNMTNYLERPGFKSNVVFDHAYYSTFGLNKDAVELQSILSKAQHYVDMEGISERWKRKVFDYNRKMLRDIMPYLVAAIGLLFLGLGMVLVLLLKNRKMSRNLESIVEQRTSELAQASRAKSDFLSSMSHEMRTPMNAIIGMAKIAENSNDVAKLKYCLSTIGTSSTHLLGLINDILDMSKIEAGKFELSAYSFNIEKMLMKICHLIADKAEEKNQQLRVVLGNGMHLNYLGDELRLSQVIANLLSNAVKFTPEGGTILLTVDELDKKEQASTLAFAVIDNGIGMTPEQVGRLFRAFEQADGSITKRFGGTGLGLAISKNIVEKMDGRIWVESEPNKGAAFHFEVSLPRSSEWATAESFSGFKASDVKVLVVEGDKAIRDHFVAIARQLGVVCHAAETGAQGAEAIAAASAVNEPYHVIFLSYRLPDGLGSDVVDQFGGEIDTSGVVLMASFLEWNKIELEMAHIGLHRFISTPLFPSAIFDSINEVVGKVTRKPEATPSITRFAPDFSHITLLLVEDVYINREIFISLLEPTLITIDTAENGREAVQKFGEYPDKYDIIIMDIQMPEMDGYEATKQIRAMSHSRAKTIPIIAMTANAFKEDVDKCLASGMNDHVAKPIDEELVVAKIALLTQE